MIDFSCASDLMREWREFFWNNHRAKKSKTNNISDYFRQSIESGSESKIYNKHRCGFDTFTLTNSLSRVSLLFRSRSLIPGVLAANCGSGFLRIIGDHFNKAVFI